MSERKMSKFLRKLFFILDVQTLLFRIHNISTQSVGIVMAKMWLSKISKKWRVRWSLLILVWRSFQALSDNFIYMTFIRKNLSQGIWFSSMKAFASKIETWLSKLWEKEKLNLNYYCLSLRLNSVKRLMRKNNPKFLST